MVDLSAMKLGLKRGPLNPKVPLLSSYIDTKRLPPAPPKTDWLGKVDDWKMLANDSVGCCVISMMGHAAQGWGSWNEGVPVVTDEEVLRIYSAITGYDPKDPNTDQGTNPDDAMAWWTKNAIAGAQLAARARVRAGDLETVKQAIKIFGFVGFSVGLPLTAQDDLDHGRPWDFHTARGRGRPDSWGGHEIVVGAYDDTSKTFECITWGKPQLMTLQFLNHYLEAVQVPVAQVWAGADDATPDGLHLADLIADSKTLH